MRPQTESLFVPTPRMREQDKIATKKDGDEVVRGRNLLHESFDHTRYRKLP